MREYFVRGCPTHMEVQDVLEEIEWGWRDCSMPYSLLYYFLRDFRKRPYRFEKIGDTYMQGSNNHFETIVYANDIRDAIDKYYEVLKEFLRK